MTLKRDKFANIDQIHKILESFSIDSFSRSKKRFLVIVL